MKKIKFLAVLMLLAIIPLVGVKAVDGTFNSYKAGSIINFYSTEDEYRAGQQGSEDVGLESIILEDSSADKQYVRALAFHATLGEAFDTKEFTKGNSAYNLGLEALETWGVTDPYIKTPGEAGNLDLISLEELIAVFGAKTTDNGETYTLDSKWNSVFESVIEECFTLAYPFNIKSQAVKAGYGFYTSTTTEDGKVWVVKFNIANETMNEKGEVTWDLTSITVEKTEITDTPTVIYAIVPVLNFDKTYDCKANPAKVEDANKGACYSCGENDYVWTTVGGAPDTCELLENVSNKADCIKPAKTGINDYAVEVIAVLAIGTLAVVLLKKKSAFKGI